MDFITPLRLLIKLEEHETLNKINIKYADIKERNAKVYGEESDGKVINLIKNKMKIEKDITTIEKAIAIVEKYAMSIAGGAVCIYEGIQNMEHSCSPNTYYAIQSDRSILFRAAIPIKKGSPITYCKVDLTKCNLFRRRLIQEVCVSCSCER